MHFCNYDLFFKLRLKYGCVKDIFYLNRIKVLVDSSPPHIILFLSDLTSFQFSFSLETYRQGFWYIPWQDDWKGSHLQHREAHLPVIARTGDLMRVIKCEAWRLNEQQMFDFVMNSATSVYSSLDDSLVTITQA